MAPGAKALPLSKTGHFKEYLIPLSLSFQMYWLNVVAFLSFRFLKLCLCPLNLVLNVFSDTGLTDDHGAYIPSIPLNILSINVAVQAYIIGCNNLANILMSEENFPQRTDL